MHEFPLTMGELTRFLPVTSFNDLRMLTTNERSRNPEGQCRDKETNVDPDIGTQCEAREPVKESHVSREVHTPTLPRSARIRK